MKTKTIATSLICATITVTMLACLFLQSGSADIPTLAPTVQKPAPTQQKLAPSAEPTKQKPAPTAKPAQPEPTSPEPTRDVPAVIPSDTPVSFATEFDLAQANQIAPEDVLNEIEYYGSGALPCPDSPYETPTLTYSPELVPFMPGYMVVCGWRTGESLEATVEYPDGKLEPAFVQVEEYEPGESLAWLSFTPQLNDPQGAYIFNMEGGPFKFMATTYYYQPDGPRLLQKSKDQLFFYGFAPQEPLRLFCYDVDTYTLLGWQAYQVDGNGQLTLDVPPGRCNFTALGPQSGEVYMLIDVFPGAPMAWISTSIKK
ncbi:MAG: hypothetical protein AB8I58_16590 [Anaerolineales bacterium]